MDKRAKFKFILKAFFSLLLSLMVIARFPLKIPKFITHIKFGPILSQFIGHFDTPRKSLDGNLEI